MALWLWLVVISDGDLSKPVSPGARPASIADAIVIGVGDPNRATAIAGHASRQDAWTLKSLAAKLDGIYHDGNTRHLPREVIERLTMVAPRVSDAIGLREAALVSLAVGCSIVGLAGPMLILFGAPAPYRRALRATVHIATATHVRVSPAGCDAGNAACVAPARSHASKLGGAT